ncbi:hypothetical protein PIB30_075148 [Stylosanthes scabra]|uniref:Uncharacterized protein n=1 Tax=Stylosanthes scabra TaxID=79078 RepID=A0ABU6YP98_9FABA|nr:hypothetical protein [Stylosanthes scabra]
MDLDFRMEEDLRDWEMEELRSLIRILSKVNMRREEVDSWVWEFDKKGGVNFLYWFLPGVAVAFETGSSCLIL